MVRSIVEISLKGEKHLFCFNNYALVEIQQWRKKHDKTYDPENDALDSFNYLNAIIEKNFLLGISLIIYCGLVGYKYSKFELNHDYKIEEISEIVGSVDMNEWTPIWEAYKEATGMSEFLKKQAEKLQTEQGESDQPKKKSHSKKNMSSQSA